MSPSPLSDSAVHIMLQYISPPSQLDRPLPHNLLSKSLLQRHHFLGISPENTSEYLSWPSPSSVKAVDLLESRPSSHDDKPQSYPIQYSSDAESTYAHVALPPTGSDGEAARLVFQWDFDGWKFHDTKLMPFPSDTSTSLPEVLSLHVPTTASRALSPAVPQYNSYNIGHSGDHGSDDEDYWNAYGADDDNDDDEPRRAQATKDEDDSEDAYWAQYSSVHGTADSTIPTPPIVRRRQVHDYSESEYQDPLSVPVHNVSGEAFSIPHVLNIPPSRWLHHHNPHCGPASPKALARLLAEISPRQSPPQFAAIIADFEDELELSPPLAGSSDDSDTLSPPDDVLGLIPEPIAENRDEAAASDVPIEVSREDEHGSSTPEIEEPLRQSIKGLYALWNSSMSQRGASSEKKTANTNKDLEIRVENLERELSVWKLALKAADHDKEVLRKEVSRLQRNIGSFTEDNPLILCLIDGDGNLFAPYLIAEGKAGGRHAAMRLTEGINNHMASVDNGGSSGRGQIWLTIYCNKKGLSETLTSNNVCTAEKFDEFFMGFNQAAPLFSFVDVGVGKEAADSKIKECLRVFTRFPQTSKVFFGGGHDNGYTSTLNQLQNEGLHTKITILRGYKDLAYELKSLNLPHIEIEGVFMTKKLQNSAKKTPPLATQNIENAIKNSYIGLEGTSYENYKPRQRENILTTPNAGTTGSASSLSPSKPQREANIAANKAMLAALGLQENIVFIPRKRAQHVKAKKRKASLIEEVRDHDQGDNPPRKVKAVAVADEDALGGPRRSGRLIGKKLDYSSGGDALRKNDGPTIVSEKARKAAEEEPMGVANRTQDPKIFGSIVGVPVGTWWETRPWVAGISGGPDGCYSVALSGGYEDDVDLGDGFTYTGSGGRDLKGTKHNPKNRSLETKKPVRVIRGYKLDSQYAPQEGYRYDGLYTVEKV
ncbi:hypothetical protein BDY19DRAFT_982245 [Irpex rosettiformis]|uniref:Uncharacterized protein n=1 Tax=Irpex rosettiformis TaxID=378272 RepID=A0ACB8UKV4_9APHY|nr:hypothetical protein BDY19DRAFT_982245 [Irpex rosettiformis]